MRPLRAVPPAIFPAILGLLGLGVAWRIASQTLLVPGQWVELYLGGAVLVAAFGVLAYGAKVALRPAVLAEDLRPLPGRAGLGALGMVIVLTGAVLLPYSGTAALVLALAGLGVQLLVAGVLAVQLLRGPAEQRQPSPVLHLPFVGAIVAVPLLVVLELATLAGLIFWLTLLAATVIGAGSLAVLRARPVPPPLRPAQVIHLAPVSLLASGALMLGKGDIAMICSGIAMGLGAVLLAKVRWLIETGFSALWAAFTFPVSALAAAMLALRAAGAPPIFGTLGSLSLVAATVLTLPIAVLVLRAWASGDLAARTNAARA
ncbi:MAG: tellurium resistance protein [Rhodobacteraceae bacterium]|nr:tellurium resistance protein [Paracoccaceae bacterium]